MKKIKILSKLVISTLLVNLFFISSIGTVTISTSSCCDCDTERFLPDLLIPSFIKMDTIGNVKNEIFYNERTGEYFNSDYPPMQGIQVDDIIQCGTRIFNNWVDTKCDKGKYADPSKTSATLYVNGDTNGIMLEDMLIASIAQNGNAFTATKFQFKQPGLYKVDFNANSDRTVKEYSYDNNWSYGGNGLYGSKKTNNKYHFWIKVEENKLVKYKLQNEQNNVASYNAPKTLEDVNKLEIVKFVKSEKFLKWCLEKKERN